MKSLGLDISTKATGVVVLQANGKTPKLLEERVLKYPAKLKGHLRTSAICSDMIDILNKHRPDIVTLEGYGFSLKHPGSIAPLAELGGVVRYFLTQYGYRYYDPRPSQLKLFITEDGHAKKPQMMSALLEKFGHKAVDDNACDAFVAALMGLAHANLLGKLSLIQLETVGQMRISACN